MTCLDRCLFCCRKQASNHPSVAGADCFFGWWWCDESKRQRRDSDSVGGGSNCRLALTLSSNRCFPLNTRPTFTAKRWIGKTIAQCVCQVAVPKTDLLAAAAAAAAPQMRSIIDTNNAGGVLLTTHVATTEAATTTTTTTTAFRWLLQQELEFEPLPNEFLKIVWSVILLMARMVPMALSVIYKRCVMRSVATLPVQPESSTRTILMRLRASLKAD